MEKLELLRKLNENLPAVAEQMIIHWGSPNLHPYMSELISKAAVDATLGVTEEITLVLFSLGDVHDQEYPQYAQANPGEGANPLEDNPEYQLINAKFPHVGKRLAATWGHAVFCSYTNSLMNDNRGGKRQGFPEDVVRGLFKLMQRHDDEFPQFALQISDIWTLNNRQ